MKGAKMLVIADIEWFDKENGYCCPTQLAFLRVDQAWEITEEFSTLFRCENYNDYCSNPVPFSGYHYDYFKNAPTAAEVLTSFSKWQKEDDIICWWAPNPKVVFSEIVKKELNREASHKSIVLNNYVSFFLFKTVKAKTNPYELANKKGISVPSIPHKSKNDVITVRNLLAEINFDQSEPSRTMLFYFDYTMMAFSQPGLAFFASHGYKFFHLRHCPILAGLTNIVGFNKYENALKNGYKPRRHCNPSRKFDVNYSIPITNQRRIDENISDIFQSVEECGFNGYMYRKSEKDEEEYIIETSVGKWRIHIFTRPIIVDHINYVKEPKNSEKYHRQHRLFLSFSDTFEYIKRHDMTLIASGSENCLLLK